MPHSFAIQAQLQVKGPPNLGPLVSKIKSGLSNIKADINLKLNPGAVSSVANMNARLNLLNKNLIQVQKNGVKANAVFQEIAKTFNSMGVSAAAVATATKNINNSINSVGKAARTAGTQVNQFGELVGISFKRFSAFSVAAATLTTFIFSVQNAFREAIKFQHELVKLSQVGGDSQASIQGISREVSNLSTSLGVSSQQLIKSAVTLRQAGLSAEEVKKSLEGLAKTDLAPNFDNLEKTTEGVIAIMSQFKIQAKDVENALGTINAVSARYAVESSDLIEAVVRSGGAFKAAGGNLNEFISLFTSVRATTRESAETISTSMRTIFARLQRPDTINSLRALGVELEDLRGQFIGPYEAIRRLSVAMRDIPTSDKRFSKIVEDIGGIRQVSKVIPLLKEFATAEEALNVGLAGQNSLTKDSALAQTSLLIRVQKLKEEFLDLFRVIGENPVFLAFADSAITLASALIAVTKALTPLIPLLTTVAAIGIGRNVAGFASSIMTGVKKPTKYAGGGFVPGTGSGDTVPAMLTPGEFVINKSSANKIGLPTLMRLNKFAKGGPVGGVGVQHFEDGGGVLPSHILEEFKKLQIGLDKIDLSKFIKAIKYVDDFSHVTKNFKGGTDTIQGLFNPKEREIQIRKGLSIEDELSTILHEFTHAFDASKGKAGVYSSQMEGTPFNEAAKLAKGFQPSWLLDAYEKDKPGRNLLHENLAFGAGSYVRSKIDPSLSGGDMEQKFFGVFENILGQIAKQYPANAASRSMSEGEKDYIKNVAAQNQKSRVSYSNAEIDKGLIASGANAKFEQERNAMFNEAIRNRINSTPTIDIPDLPGSSPKGPKRSMSGLIGRGVKGLKSLGGKGLGLGSLALPFVSEQLLGTARNPGFLGRTGAGIGGVLSGAAAGAGIGSAIAPGIGTFVGALVGATASLVSFNKELKDIDFERMSSSFAEAVGLSSKSPGSKAKLASLTGGIEKQISESDQSQAGWFGSSGWKSLGIAFGAMRHGSFAKAAEQDRAATDQETADKFKPLLSTVLNEFKTLAQANPGKTMAELEQMNKELAHSKFVLARFNTEEVRATTIAINNAAKQIKVQQNVDNSIAKLGISVDQLSQKISIAGDALEKNLARNDVGRGGRVSGGTDFFNIGSLGAQGKEIQNFTKTGGVLDTSRLAIQKALEEATGKGQLGSDSVENTILDSLKKQGIGEDNATGKLLADSIRNALSGAGGEDVLRGINQGNIKDALDKILGDPEKLRGEANKANEEFLKAQQLLAQNAVKLAEDVDRVRGEQEKVNQFALGANKDLAANLMRNNDTSFFDGRGGVISPEDQLAEINSRFARSSFDISQRRFGVSGGESAEGILAKLNVERGNLSGLKNQAFQAAQNGGRPQDFSKAIADSTMKIRNYQEALNNLANSTTILEASQQKLQIALDKEAADLAGRKGVGEERAFGSRGDIIKGMMSDQLIGMAVQQGHLENFSDEQRQMTLQRLQQTAGVERNFGGQRFNGQQIIDALSSQYMPQSNIPSSMVRTPNGVRAVSNDVLSAQTDVSGIQSRMADAGNALVKFNQADVIQQASEHVSEFGELIKKVNGPLGELFDSLRGGKGGGKAGVAGFANGGMARGTDTVPAMLSPGEFIVSASNARRNIGVLNKINNGAAYMAGGGSVGFEDFADQQDIAATGSTFSKKIELQEQARRERAKEIQKRVARRQKLGLPEYVPVSKRVDNSPANAFNDPEASKLRGEQISRENYNRNRTIAAQNIANRGNRGFNAPAVAVNNGGGNGFQEAARQMVDNSKPLVDALNSFPRELVVKRDGNINVVINGAETISKIKGDLEKEVWDKIIQTIQREVPKVVKSMPG